MKKTSSGIAGEFYVAAELTRRGMKATPKKKRTESIDVIAINPVTHYTEQILVSETDSVKSNGQWGFRYRNDDEQKKDIKDKLWYVFVDLNGGFKCYIISAKDLYPIVQERKTKYEEVEKKRNGESHVKENRFWFIPKDDCVDENKKPKENNWEDLPILKETSKRCK